MNPDTLATLLAMGDDHTPGNGRATPLRPDAFALTNDEKIARIERSFREIMLTLGLDLTDGSLRGTPHRVAKMYVQELFSGLDPANEPAATLFENSYRYGQMLLERGITVHSTCEHHFVPIIGQAHVAYISAGQVIGLSKINRIVQHYAKRPQVQERMTVQIAEHLARVLRTPDVAVVVDAKHYCVALRGVQDAASSTVTADFRGRFLAEPALREEFFKMIALPETLR